MKYVMALVLTGLTVLPVVGCSSSRSSDQEEAAPRRSRKAGASTVPVVPAPAGTPLATISVGMSQKQVMDLIGPPTDTNTHVTGKAFNPFYYGSDRARIELLYKGQGRVSIGGNGRVVNIVYDPNEDGYNSR